MTDSEEQTKKQEENQALLQKGLEYLTDLNEEIKKEIEEDAQNT